MSTYTEAKQQLEETAKDIKAKHRNDKPLCRQVINDTADMLVKDFPASLSEAKKEQYSLWLHNLAANLHP